MSNKTGVMGFYTLFSRKDKIELLEPSELGDHTFVTFTNGERFLVAATVHEIRKELGD